MPNKDYFIYKNMFKENFTKEELHLARENGFILVGKTGSGKSTLLNVIFDKEVAEVKRSAFAVTTEPQVYYLKLKDGLCVSLVDTPGLSDPKIISKEQKLLDNIHLAKIEMAIAEENINIKGILFLVNFQLERFDESEQKALLSYNQIFPLKRFWKHLIVIFTHHFSDPIGDTTEEMRKSRDESNGIIFSLLMKKVKNVSDVIDYKELRVKYYNSYSPVKNEKQKIQNSKNKEDLEILLNDLSHKEPLFCQIEVIHIKNEILKENDKYYLCEYEIIGYFDLNHAPLKEITNFIQKEETDEKIVQDENQKLPKPEVNISAYKADLNPGDNIDIKEYVDVKDISYYLKYIFACGASGIGGAALGVLGGLAYVGGITSGIGLGTAISAGAAAAGSVLAAPVAIGALVVGATGVGISYAIKKLFD